MEIHAQWMFPDIALLPFMASFCLNVMGQFHAHPGVGNERKHLACQLVGKGSKIGHPDASLIKISKLVFPWRLGSDEGLNCCLPGHMLPFSSKELLSHPCHCSCSWAFAKAEQEQLPRCVSPCEWTGHTEPLKQRVTRALRVVVRVGMCSHPLQLPSLLSCCKVLTETPDSDKSTFWVNKPAFLLVVRNACEE